jgi:hypothetical protein
MKSKVQRYLIFLVGIVIISNYSCKPLTQKEEFEKNGEAQFLEMNYQDFWSSSVKSIQRTM